MRRNRLSRLNGARIERELVPGPQAAGIAAETGSCTGYRGADLRMAEQGTAEVNGLRVERHGQGSHAAAGRSRSFPRLMCATSAITARPRRSDWRNTDGAIGHGEPVGTP
jgi:hypothetical protein